MSSASVTARQNPNSPKIKVKISSSPPKIMDLLDIGKSTTLRKQNADLCFTPSMVDQGCSPDLLISGEDTELLDHRNQGDSFHLNNPYMTTDSRKSFSVAFSPQKLRIPRFPAQQKQFVFDPRTEQMKQYMKDQSQRQNNKIQKDCEESYESLKSIEQEVNKRKTFLDVNPVQKNHIIILQIQDEQDNKFLKNRKTSTSSQQFFQHVNPRYEPSRITSYKSPSISQSFDKFQSYKKYRQSYSDLNKPILNPILDNLNHNILLDNCLSYRSASKNLPVLNNNEYQEPIKDMVIKPYKRPLRALIAQKKHRALSELKPIAEYLQDSIKYNSQVQPIHIQQAFKRYDMKVSKSIVSGGSSVVQTKSMQKPQSLQLLGKSMNGEVKMQEKKRSEAITMYGNFHIHKPKFKNQKQQKNLKSLIQPKGLKFKNTYVTKIPQANIFIEHKGTSIEDQYF